MTGVDDLRAVAGGDLAGFYGLGSTHDRDAAEAALGPSEAGADGSARLGAQWLGFRRYPACSVAPFGLTVYFVGDSIAHVEVPQPKIDDATEQLGAPDDIRPSGLAPVHDLLIWADRGVILHRHRYNDSAARLDLFAPADLESVQASWMVGLSVRRHRR